MKRSFLCIAYVAGVQKGREGKGLLGTRETREAREEGGKGKPSKTLLSLRYNIHQVNVKILIGQGSKQMSITPLMP